MNTRILLDIWNSSSLKTNFWTSFRRKKLVFRCENLTAEQSQQQGNDVMCEYWRIKCLDLDHVAGNRHLFTACLTAYRNDVIFYGIFHWAILFRTAQYNHIWNNRSLLVIFVPNTSGIDSNVVNWEGKQQAMNRELSLLLTALFQLISLDNGAHD